MELANFSEEIKRRIGLCLKENILASWLSEIRSKSDAPNSLKAIIDFIAKKDVDLGSISEKEECPFISLNSEFQVFNLPKSKLFQIIDVENIAENYEMRHLETNNRTLKFKLTDGFFVYTALEEQKINLSKLINRFKQSLGQKPQPFDLNNLINKKILLKEGTIYRRNAFLLRGISAILIEEFEDLDRKNENQTFQNQIGILDQQGENQGVEDEIMVEEFIDYMDEL